MACKMHFFCGVLYSLNVIGLADDPLTNTWDIKILDCGFNNLGFYILQSLGLTLSLAT